MPKRTVVLTDELDALVSTYVESGRYQDESEVLREGLRLLERRDHQDAERLELLRSAIQVGEAAYARGDYITLERDEIGPYLSTLGGAEKPS